MTAEKTGQASFSALRDTMCLSQVPQHELVCMDRMNCPPDVSCRLASLGILPDVPLEVVRVTRRGAVLIRVSEMLLALSESIAQQIAVHRTESGRGTGVDVREKQGTDQTEERTASCAASHDEASQNRLTGVRTDNREGME